MPLTPIDEAHALQIQAGTLGRNTGHKFEDNITSCVNGFQYPLYFEGASAGHVFVGNPAYLLLSYIAQNKNIKVIKSAVGISTGALATLEDGKKWLLVNGVTVTKCKSDLIITIVDEHDNSQTIGISIKQCNNKTPTNAQLYFTTARGFSKLLQANGIPVTDNAQSALRQFCGDAGFRPSDNSALNTSRLVDPRRYFWEEINLEGRLEWEEILTNRQDEVSRLLFQKAYLDDPFTPEFLLHKTKAPHSEAQIEVAIYSIDELITLSRNYQGFAKKSYSVRKGMHKDPIGTSHDAPRFGVIQMQRGGQKQHPEQLQFNLQAGYFYKI